ncbi:MAG: hypothetical protein KatS3mg014_2445 [Actinomycetota bacterium]|nr:MAG: hypothetical protein KatS3mg014_2445 [Actinomycetota bacterium]
MRLRRHDVRVVGVVMESFGFVADSSDLEAGSAVFIGHDIKGDAVAVVVSATDDAWLSFARELTRRAGRHNWAIPGVVG